MLRLPMFSLVVAGSVKRLSVLGLSLALLVGGGLVRSAKAVDDVNGISLLSGGDTINSGSGNSSGGSSATNNGDDDEPEEPNVVLNRSDAERAIADGAWVTGQSFLSGTDNVVDTLTYRPVERVVSNGGDLDDDGNPTQGSDVQTLRVGQTVRMRLAHPLQVPQDPAGRAALQQNLLNRLYNLRDIVEWENQQCQSASQWYYSNNDPQSQAFYAREYQTHKARLDSFNRQLQETRLELAAVSY